MGRPEVEHPGQTGGHSLFSERPPAGELGFARTEDRGTIRILRPEALAVCEYIDSARGLSP